MNRAVTGLNDQTMKLSVYRELPDGNILFVVPFHVCMKGLEDAIICRDEQDYDIMVKVIFLSALAKNVIVVIYAVLSNHCHVSVLSADQESADAFGEEVKRRYSMWLSRKYNERKLMQGVKISALMMADRWHVRNALAYIPRNALDNGQNVNTYKWSGYRAMFCRQEEKDLRLVRTLTRREAREIFHTCDKLDNVRWKINSRGEIDPASACDHEYLEQAFEHDQAFFLKTIGALNFAEQRYVLEEKPFNMIPDSELYKYVNDFSERWFGKNLGEVPVEKRIRLLMNAYHTQKTTVSQLARVFSFSRDTVRGLISSGRPRALE